MSEGGGVGLKKTNMNRSTMNRIETVKIVKTPILSNALQDPLEIN